LYNTMADNNRNESLEQFFRKKSGEYDISYREEDWLKLEEKLIFRDKQNTSRKIIYWVAAASILIISTLGYFIFDNYQSINELNSQLSNNITPPIGDPEQGFEEVPGAGITEQGNDGSKEMAAGESREDEADEDERVVTLSEQISESPEEVIKERMEQSSDGMLTLEDLTIPTITGSEFLASGFSVTLNDYYMIPNDRMTRFGDKSTSSLNVEPHVPTISEPEGFYREDDTSLPITLGLALTPDLSTVGSLSNFHQPGYKFGLTIEYEVSQNLSVLTGIVSTTVRYSVAGRNYNPPVYWNSGVSPVEIIGECLLLDIPIGVKYDFLNFTRSRFFATAGLSSYVMLNEDYQFQYEGYNTGLAEGWSGKTGTRHWMSNAGFSIGYELDLHKNWSIRAEPYIKVPVREVGWANVRLYSMGSFVSVNFRL
jgi:hypothetical protein